MISSAKFLYASEAASRIGVSAKALRLYEQRGLIFPIRNLAGWRVYGPDAMSRASDIATLRTLGFTLAQVARVLGGKSDGLESALIEHQAALEDRLHQLIETIETIGGLRRELARGTAPTVGELARLTTPESGLPVALDLPYPWGGERFELGHVRSLNYIIGPLGSGKTQLALRLAETLPNAAFLGLDRSMDGVVAQDAIDADSTLGARVDQTLTRLAENGATKSDALVALITGLESVGPAMLVIDMIEQGLDRPTQEAIANHLRGRDPGGWPIFMLTRSSAILDLTVVGVDDAIILCPANHSPPTYVAPYPGTSGYEAVATCLATPEVRARTDGVIAQRPLAA